MHPERVVIARVSTVVDTAVTAAIVAVSVVIATAFRAFGSLLHGHLFPII
jgi:hypothetical protein